MIVDSTEVDSGRGDEEDCIYEEVIISLCSLFMEDPPLHDVHDGFHKEYGFPRKGNS